MATIGQVLTAPENGWKRIEDSDVNITYEGSTWQVFSDTSSSGGNYRRCSQSNDTIKFNFIGTKLRVIGATNKWGSEKVNVIVDGATTVCSFLGSLAYQVVIFEVVNLPKGEHSVKIENLENDYYLWFDALDIDDIGELKPYMPVVRIGSPVNLEAKADNKVTLTWNAVTGATGYNVKRSTTAGGPYTTIATKVTDTRYVDNTVTNGTTYYYVVTAVDASGNESTNSNEASATSVASSKAILQVTMIDSSEREYRVSTEVIDGFINWYTRTIGTGISCYAIDDIVDDSKEYLSFEKIISFKVIPLTK
ncbi:hypothetical protein [Pelosinus sp. IPA-1]|uniref:hypothetical protein n=1 Tax=Pelosinus sp. IPA-1 TaxID=3029569 RepID=UPI00243617D9|nr:hypothetical protein [Pelosinus sp. IPA-1]GMB02268.1 hypothetical protein PIPA1_50690 [Pelosinus sp. IPA-1]